MPPFAHSERKDKENPTVKMGQSPVPGMTHFRAVNTGREYSSTLMALLANIITDLWQGLPVYTRVQILAYINRDKAQDKWRREGTKAKNDDWQNSNNI